MDHHVWPFEASGYDIIGNIGRGAFSRVCRARCKTNESLVAIKVMELEHITTSFEDILQEVQTMRLSDHENILRCFCSFVERDQLWLVTQLMDCGSCLRVMSVAKSLGLGEGMNEDWLAYILRETLQGLHYLHHNGQIHRDIKSGNILLDSTGSVRLADFGVSGWTVQRGQRQDTVKTFVGTPCYMAPEVLEQVDGYDSRADIWSLGITALELAKGAAPYAHHSPMRVLVLTLEEQPPSLRSYSNDKQRTGAPFPKAFEDFYKRCLQKSPRERPTAEELLKHKFLRNRSKEALVNQLLNHICPVGDVASDSSHHPRLPGQSSVVLERREGLEGDQRSGKDKEWVSGTTWVFDSDGSGGSLVFGGKEKFTLKVQSVQDEATVVIASSAVSSAGSASASVQDFIDDFETDVGLVSSSPLKQPSTVPASPTILREHEDLSTDAFMDELEELVDGNG